MAKGDIVPFVSSGSKTPGAIRYYVASGTTASINAGEPVQKLAGAAGVTAMLTNSPTTTNLAVGISASASTETASAAGYVDVIPAAAGQLFLANPKVAASWDTQAEYNALIGSRVLLDLTSSTYTILATDNSANGCIVEYLNIAEHPGKVCFSFAQGKCYSN